MKKNVFSFIIFIFFTLNFEAQVTKEQEIDFQKNKMNKQGQRTGLWTNVYLFDTISFIEGTDIPNWQNSIYEFKGNIGNVMAAFSNPNPDISFRYLERRGIVIETCEYSNGVKNGNFKMQLCEAEGYGWNSPMIIQILSGSYVNDKFSGNLTYCLDTTSYGQSRSKLRPYVNISYTDGKISDQKSICELGIRKYFSLMENTSFEEKEGIFKTYYVFKDGKLIESLFLHDGYPCYISSDGLNGFYLLFTSEPLCYHQFSFLTNKEKNDDRMLRSLITLNTNKPAVEYIPFVVRNDVKIIDGNYRLFKPAMKCNLSDTTHLWASYQFKDGKRNGTAEIWDKSINGKTETIPFIRMTYENDKLNGLSEMYFPDHKLAVRAEFVNGYPSGLCKAYSNMPNYYTFTPNYLIKAWVHSGGILSIHQIGEFDKSLLKEIEISNQYNGNHTISNGYELFTEIIYHVDSLSTKGEFYKGSVPSEDFIYSVNGKPVVKFIIETESPKKFKYSDKIWFNNNGAVIHSLSGAEAQRKLDIIKFDNTLTPCSVCQKQIKNKDAYGITDCNCKKPNGYTITFERLKTDYFCSIECKMLFLKNYCIDKGYRLER